VIKRIDLGSLFIMSLTQLFCENFAVKNLEVLKKYLTNVTRTIVYLPFGYAIRIISTFSQELHPILGDFVRRYANLEVTNLWYYSNWRMALGRDC